MEAKNMIVLITGVGRKEGIGYGVAAEMAKQGFTVIIAARDYTNVKSLAEQLNKTTAENIIPQQLDITNEESVTSLSDYVNKNFKKLDILINNAGAGFDYGVQPLDTDFKVTRDAIETNLFGTWRMVKRFYSLLKKSERPRIVNISSGAGTFSDPIFGLSVHPALMTSYGISKLALNGLTVKLARQLKEDKIIINSIEPGFTATAPGMENMGARPVKESVEGIIWAATLPDDGPTGGFFRDKKPLSW